MRKGLWLSVVVLTSVYAQVSYAQGEIRTNEKGEKIIVLPDGTWQLFGQSQGGTDYPKSTVEIGSLNVSVRLTEEDALRIATRRMQLAREAVVIASNRERQATLQRERIEAEMKTTASAAPAQSLDAQRNTLRVTAARENELEAKKETALARKELETAEKAANSGDYLQELNKVQAGRPSQVNLPKANELVQSYAPTFLAAANAGYALDTDLKDGLAARAPGAACAFTFNGMDESGGRWRKELRKELLFTYTHERLRLFLKDKEYLRCEGFMTASGGFRSLVLEFTFVLPNAREAYGFIEKGSVLTLRLLNGQHVNLASGPMAKGSYDTRREELTYRVEYLIDQSVLSLLNASELDAVRVFWSSGYEEYPVYNLDFFMKQLACLDK
jgi:hypothetical protein